MTNSIFFFTFSCYPTATKLGQGNVFTGVCDSVNRGKGSAPRGSAPGGVPDRDPPGRPLLQAVRILLECILVSFIFAGPWRSVL